MDIEKIDLNLLRIFDAIIRTRNITMAGELVGLSQPAVSFALNKLRKLTSDQLFVRTTNGMEPTPRAVAMSAPIRHVLEVVHREVFLQEAFDPAESKKIFTLSLSDIGEMVFLPKLMKQLHLLAPNVTLRSVSMPPEKLEMAMETGEVDLAVGYFPDIVKTNFYQQHLFTHSFACLIRADHPVIKKKLTLRQFLDAKHILVRAEGRSQEILERYLIEKHIERKIGLVIPHFMSIPYLLAESEMVATIPLSCARVFAQSNNCRVVALPFESPTFDLKQYWHVRYHRDGANQWLRNIFHDTFLVGLD
jgi:DNA-binding transcriptional LysR family regulator